MNSWQSDVLDLVLDAKFMALATADNEGRPWISPLVYACDQRFRFYWVSAHEALHSKNVRSNPRAALSIYNSNQRPNISIQGFYAEGLVDEIEPAELPTATRLFYGWRYPVLRVLAEKLRGPEYFMGESARRMYRLTASRMYGLDPKGHPIWGNLVDFRTEVSLHEEFAKYYAKKYSHLLNPAE